jgi:serine/threonine protein kinase
VSTKINCIYNLNRILTLCPSKKFMIFIKRQNGEKMRKMRIGKYEVVEEIGRGGMGVVYKAIDPHIGRIVAIKTRKFDADDLGSTPGNLHKRFFREAHSAGSLSHPNIVRIYEAAEDEGQFFIVMEYVEGQSLEDLIQTKKKKTLEEIIGLIYQVAEGLECAHQKGIIHRDIKPGNILIDRNGRPRIVDFGIARSTASTLSQSTILMGTPFYMSPEQIAGKKVDHRSDIFSLGVVFYEMLTGLKPFLGEEITAIIYKIVNEEPPSVRIVHEWIPEEIDQIISKMIAKSPGSRYSSCRSLIQDLDGILRAISVTSPKSETQIQKTIRAVSVQRDNQKNFATDHRRKSIVIILLAMLVLAGATIVVILFFPTMIGLAPKNREDLRQAPQAIATIEKPGKGRFEKKEDPSTNPMVLGEQLLQQDKLSEALAVYKLIPATSPDYDTALSKMAIIDKKLGQRVETITELKRLIAKDLRNAPLYLQLAEIYDNAGDVPSAISSYESYLQYSKNDTASASVQNRINILKESHQFSRQSASELIPEDSRSIHNSPENNGEGFSATTNSGQGTKSQLKKQEPLRSSPNPMTSSETESRTEIKVKSVVYASNMVLISAGSKQGMIKGLRGHIKSGAEVGHFRVISEFTIVQIMPSYSYARLENQIDSIQVGDIVEIIKSNENR